MTRPRSSLGPSDAKMDAALIRNLQRLCGERGKELTNAAACIAELEAEVARLREALVIASAALAAALSLMERASILARKFPTMFADYHRALKDARAALAAPDTGGADGE